MKPSLNEKDSDSSSSSSVFQDDLEANLDDFVNQVSVRLTRLRLLLLFISIDKIWKIEVDHSDYRSCKDWPEV